MHDSLSPAESAADEPRFINWGKTGSFADQLGLPLNPQNGHFEAFLTAKLNGNNTSLPTILRENEWSAAMK